MPSGFDDPVSVYFKFNIFIISFPHNYYILLLSPPYKLSLLLIYVYPCNTTHLSEFDFRHSFYLHFLSVYIYLYSNGGMNIILLRCCYRLRLAILSLLKVL